MCLCVRKLALFKYSMCEIVVLWTMQGPLLVSLIVYTEVCLVLFYLYWIC